MTFWSGHGTHLRLLSCLERSGCCHGSLQRMGWPNHHLVTFTEYGFWILASHSQRPEYDNHPIFNILDFEYASAYSKWYSSFKFPAIRFWKVFAILQIMGRPTHPPWTRCKYRVFWTFVPLSCMSNFQMPTALSKTKIGIIKWLYILWIWPEKYFSAQKSKKILPFIF